MNNSLRTVLLVAGVVVVVGIGILMRRVTAPPPEPSPSRAPVARAPHAAAHYSSRVEERLKMLRADYAQRHQDSAAQPATERGSGDATNAGGSPPLAPRVAGKYIPPSKLSRVRKPWPHPKSLDRNESVQELENTILNDRDPDNRLDALLKLSGVDEGDAVRILTMAINDPDPEVRSEVIDSLGDYPDFITPDILQPALKDKDPDVRFEAVSTLGGLNSPAALDAVRAALNDPDEDVRGLAQGILDLGRNG